MTADVIKLNSSHVKECTIPAALQKIEKAEAAFVLTITDGNWNFQSIKSGKSTLELIGLLRCVSRKLEQTTDVGR
jgi:hypothetical protein